MVDDRGAATTTILVDISALMAFTSRLAEQGKRAKPPNIANQRVGDWSSSPNVDEVCDETARLTEAAAPVASATGAAAWKVEVLQSRASGTSTTRWSLSGEFHDSVQRFVVRGALG